jgi:hypothetical protein
MRRNYLWIILSGITLISVIILVELITTIVYLHSPERVVSGSFQKLINAKSYSFNANADDGYAALTLGLNGNIDQKQPTRPAGEATFSFDMGSRFSLKGQITAADGKAFIKFDNAVGLPVGFVNALGSAWAGVDVNALYLLFQENALSFSSPLNDTDIAVILKALKNNFPLVAAGDGSDEMLDNAYVVRYPVRFDKNVAVEFLYDLHGLLQKQNFSEDKYKAAVNFINNAVAFGGTVWVAKSDGTLRALQLAIPLSLGGYLNLTVSFSDYNKKVTAAAPDKSTPLQGILKGVLAPTLNPGSVSEETPSPYASFFKPFIDLPTLPLENNSGSGLVYPTNTVSGGGGFMDMILKFFYGFNPFSGSNQNKVINNVFNVNTQK